MAKNYKLSDQVVDFIVQTKNADPRLGCREISRLLEEKFSKKFSKSSVNNILKSKGLSKSVGRPGSQKKPVQGSQIDNAANIFLVALYYKLCLPLIFQQFFDAVFKQPEPDVDKKLALAMFSKLFFDGGIEGLNEYKGQGLWKLVNAGKRLKYEDIKETVSKIDKLDIVEFLAKAVETGLDFVAKVAFSFKTKEALVFDPGLRTVIAGTVVDASFYEPIIYSENKLRQVLESNQCICLLPVSPEQLKYIIPVARSLSQENNLESISLLAADGSVLSKLDNSSSVVTFVVPVINGQSSGTLNLTQLGDEIEASIGHFDKPILLQDHDVLITQEDTLVKPLSLRGITVKLSDKDNMLFLTNISKEVTALEVVREYFNRYTYGFEIKGLKNDDREKICNSFISNKLGDFSVCHNLDCFLSLILDYLRSLLPVFYFPDLGASDHVNFAKEILSLNGNIESGRDSAKLTLQAPKDPHLYVQLEKACARFNQELNLLDNRPILIFVKRI